MSGLDRLLKAGEAAASEVVKHGGHETREIIRSMSSVSTKEVILLRDYDTLAEKFDCQTENCKERPIIPALT